jgi:predicted membrane GTPase involved in stress response
MAADMEPLFQAILKEIAAPTVKEDAPLQMLVSGTGQLHLIRDLRCWLKSEAGLGSVPSACL